MMKSTYGIEAVHLCFNGTGICGGEAIGIHKGFGVLWSFVSYFQLLDEDLQLYNYIQLIFNIAVIN